MQPDIWSYREETWTGRDLTDFKVEAVDGRIGSIDEATHEVGASHIVVDTGPWIFGKKVVLPAGVIESVDTDSETVFVDRTKEEIKNAPELDLEGGFDDTRRRELGDYYGTRRAERMPR
jgi:hypothetical protein